MEKIEFCDIKRNYMKLLKSSITGLLKLTDDIEEIDDYIDMLKYIKALDRIVVGTSLANGVMIDAIKNEIFFDKAEYELDKKNKNAKTTSLDDLC